MNGDDKDLVREIMVDHEAMKQERYAFEQQWNEVIEIMLPRFKKFGEGKQTPGEKRTSKIYDATPGLAHRHLSAAMESIVSPRTQRYQKLKRFNQRNERQSVKLYLEEVTTLMFAYRYRWRASFTTAIGEYYATQAAFGAAGLMIEDGGSARHPIRYRHIRLANLLYAEGADGLVDKAHMLWCLTARQAAERWGRSALPTSIQNVLERAPETKLDFIHAVRPRKDRDVRKRDGRNMAFQSVWLHGSDIVQHGGFRTFPVAVGRLASADGSQYAYSPAMDALPDIKMLNDMERTNIRGAQKAVDPPLLLPEDGVLDGFNLTSGALNYGGLDERGEQMVRPLELGKNVPLGLEYADQKRQSVNLAFYVSLFQILVDNPQMTATEVLQRQQEKGFLLAPTMGRNQAETLGPLTDRELDLLGNYDLLPEMPAEMLENDGEVEVEYDSPLNRAMRAEEVVNTQRWLELIAPLSQADPKVLTVPNGPKIARGMADVMGVPADFVNAEEEAEEQADAMDAQAQAAQLLEAAPVAASSAKDLTAAVSNMQNVPI